MEPAGRGDDISTEIEKELELLKQEQRPSAISSKKPYAFVKLDIACGR